MLSNRTVDHIGVKTVTLKTTGHEKLRVTVCLAAKGDRSKLKLMVVFKGAIQETKTLNEDFRGRCFVMSSSNAWMNEHLTGVAVWGSSRVRPK